MVDVQAANYDEPQAWGCAELESKTLVQMPVGGELDIRSGINVDLINQWFANQVYRQQRQAETTLSFIDKQLFFAWVDIQGFTRDHVYRRKRIFSKYFYNKAFESSVELARYIQGTGRDLVNLMKTARLYLRFCEETDKYPVELLNKYRLHLKVKHKAPDYHVPSDQEVLHNYRVVKGHKALHALYLLLATSGLRIREATRFLRNIESYKPVFCEGFVCCNITSSRGNKHSNNVYVPRFVFDELFKVDLSSDYLVNKYNSRGCVFSLKYLRKWQYNFLIYRGVPESVADFIQGRSSRGVGANHYLARAQQAAHWYGSVVPALSAMFIDESDER